VTRIREPDEPMGCISATALSNRKQIEDIRDQAQRHRRGH
jgi:hypothetical protein